MQLYSKWRLSGDKDEMVNSECSKLEHKEYMTGR